MDPKSRYILSIKSNGWEGSVDFPLIFKLGINSVFKISTDNHTWISFTSMQQNIKYWEIIHNINTIILGMETLEKTQDGKTCAAIRYRFYYEKIWKFYNHCKFTQTWRIQYPTKSLGKSQPNLNTLLCECTSQLYEARWSCCSLLRLLS